MKITKYRTVAIIYPWLSLECEVVDGDKKYYPNISVNDKGEQEELYDDGHWCYCKPMDMIGYDENGNEIDYDEDVAMDIMLHNLVCHDFFTWNFEEWRPMTDDEIKQSKKK